MDLKQQIKIARIKANVNQLNLAIRMGCSKQTISNWETGVSSPDMETLKKLSKQLDTSFIID